MLENIQNFLNSTGVAQLFQSNDWWKTLIMFAISAVLVYLAIVKKFEPLLLLPIAIGMLLTNLPGSEVFHEALFAGGHVNWALFGGAPTLSALDWPQAVLFLAAFFLLRWKKPSPILTMFGCGLLYLLLHLP